MLAQLLMVIIGFHDSQGCAEVPPSGSLLLELFLSCEKTMVLSRCFKKRKTCVLVPISEITPSFHFWLLIVIVKLDLHRLDAE